MDAKFRWRSDWLDGPVSFWPCEFQGTPWSNKSDANPPGGDTKPPKRHDPQSLMFNSSIVKMLKY